MMHQQQLFRGLNNQPTKNAEFEDRHTDFSVKTVSAPQKDAIARVRAP